MALDDIALAVRKGKYRDVPPLVREESEKGTDAKVILEEGLLKGLNEIGALFAANKVFVPEVMIAAKSMQAGVDELKDKLAGKERSSIGKVCIGTVFGDRHDIGKNLVKIMMEGRGFTVIDLGFNVPAEKFVDTALREDCSLIACSALLSTTMPEMKKVAELLKEKAPGGKIRLMVGGAPVTQEFADAIGADLYAPDAASAAERAAELVGG